MEITILDIGEILKDRGISGYSFALHQATLLRPRRSDSVFCLGGCYLADIVSVTPSEALAGENAAALDRASLLLVPSPQPLSTTPRRVLLDAGGSGRRSI